MPVALTFDVLSMHTVKTKVPFDTDQEEIDIADLVSKYLEYLQNLEDKEKVKKEMEVDDGYRKTLDEYMSNV